MRWVFLVLLAVNIGFGVFVYLRDKAPNPDAQLIALQMNADKVRIVPPRPAPAPAPVTASARVACAEWGGFGAGELARAQNALDRLALGARARRVEVSVTAGYWVFIPPQRSQAAMERKLTELKELRVSEYFPLLDPGRWRYAISLGVFRSEEGAARYLAQLRQKGVRSATVPTEEESAKFAELKNEFPGTELRAVECH